MKALLLVFLGGGLGSAARYLVYRSMTVLNLSLPWGTFTVNFAGSFLLGLILGYALKEGQVSNNLILLLGTGFCGGFTTFSTFAFENQDFLRTGDYFHFAFYAFGSIFIGILAVMSGLFLSKFI